MPDHAAPFDFFAQGELPAPDLSVPEVAGIAEALGLGGGVLQPLGSQQDQNLLVVDDGEPTAVLKIANPAFSVRESQAQDAAAAQVQAACPDLRIGTVLQRDGAPLARTVETSAGALYARTLRYLPGGTLVGRGWLSPNAVARMGRIAGRVSAALADFDHPGLDRTLQWDLRQAHRVVTLLAPHHPDSERRAQVVAAADAAWAAVQRVADALPVQPGHFDLTDDNLVAEPGGFLPDGIIDFGDVSRSWRVAELAVTLSCLLHHPGGEPHTVLPAVRAFDAEQPLTEAEVEALWPLVVLRGAVLVVSGEHQVGVDAANVYASAALDREWSMFEGAVAVPTPVMTALVRDALGRPSAVQPPESAARSLAPAPELIDLSVTSPVADEGAWLTPGLDERVAADRLAAGVPAVAAAYRAPRISEARPLSAQSTPTVPTSVTVWPGEDLPLAAPWSGTLTVVDGRIELLVGDIRVVVHGAHPAGTGDVQAGDPIGTAPAGTRIEVQLVAAEAPEVPLLVRPELAAGWLALTADPAALLGLPAASRPHDPMPDRVAHLADVQEHYYDDPPRIERGWRTYLVDTDARVYLDMVNNVTSVGHAHPQLAAAVGRQLALLNTNSRFHYGAVAEFATALAATLPDPLDTVFLVNSGSEAVDLAIRLAMAATGRRDVVAVREAYHGWTYASDAVSTSVADNPNALATRPDWVHTVDAPNSYRGVHRDAEAWRYAPEAVERIEALVADGRPPAAFLAEAFFGNAGGVALPPGYLEQVYAAVRRAGGLAIADEVQVGYGRLGSWFWGFQQQGVVPDIVAVAKSMGAGHPLGAVVTSAEVAARYREGGYFFSSTGGSPVSSVVGLTVLDIIRDEGLQERARTVGAHLKQALEALADHHPLIGAVHGEGLYLGVEFVRDRETREPATEETALICDRLRTLGVIMQPTGDFQNVLKIKPPLVLTGGYADFFVEQLDRAVVHLW